MRRPTVDAAPAAPGRAKSSGNSAAQNSDTACHPEDKLGKTLSPVTGALLALDARRLSRAACLAPGGRKVLSCGPRGDEGAEDRVLVVAGVGAVDVCWNDDGGFKRQRLQLAYTTATIAGHRTWFVCPTCCRRAAILYGVPFECRDCSGLSYPSQREDTWERALRRAQDLRERLGGTRNALEPIPPRPAGMHAATYRRLRDHLEAAEARAFGAVAARLNLRRRGVQ